MGWTLIADEDALFPLASFVAFSRSFEISFELRNVKTGKVLPYTDLVLLPNDF